MYDIDCQVVRCSFSQRSQVLAEKRRVGSIQHSSISSHNTIHAICTTIDAMLLPNSTKCRIPQRPIACDLRTCRYCTVSAVDSGSSRACFIPCGRAFQLQPWVPSIQPCLLVPSAICALLGFRPLGRASQILSVDLHVILCSVFSAVGSIDSAVSFSSFRNLCLTWFPSTRQCLTDLVCWPAPYLMFRVFGRTLPCRYRGYERVAFPVDSHRRHCC